MILAKWEEMNFPEKLEAKPQFSFVSNKEHGASEDRQQFKRFRQVA